MLDLYPEIEGLTVDLGSISFRRQNLDPLERFFLAALVALRQPKFDLRDRNTRRCHNAAARATPPTRGFSPSTWQRISRTQLRLAPRRVRRRQGMRPVPRARTVQ